MCEITRTVKRPTEKEIWAWKIFDWFGVKKGWRPPCYSSTRLKAGKWQKSEKGPGFYAFTSKKTAKNSFLYTPKLVDFPSCLVRVKLRYVTGMKGKILIANEIFVPCFPEKP